MAIDDRFYTNAVHGGCKVEPQTGAITTPIFQTSTYVQSAPGEHKGFDYSRADNPTRQILEASLASLEGCEYALAFSSGLAAAQAVIQTLSPGCRVLVCDDVYGGTGRLFRELFAKYQIEFVFIDMSNDAEIEAELVDHTSLIWLESPTNPTMKVIDIAKMSSYAKKVGATLLVDNTFPSPIFQQPFSLGADIVLHSTTKYIGGHCDLIGGALMLREKHLFDEVKFVQFAAGAVPSPFESFLLLRSIKTLAIRMQQHEHNAFIVARFLEAHPRVERVYYPGLESHPQYDLAKAQMSGFSGMLSFVLRGSYEDVLAVSSKLEIFALAESLGGVESLINHPEKMTHASVPENLRKKLGIGPNLLRLSVGIESATDLVADLKQALNA